MTAIADPDTYARLKAYFASIHKPMPPHYLRAEKREPIRLISKREVEASEREARQAARTRQRLHSDGAEPRSHTKVSLAW